MIDRIAHYRELDVTNPAAGPTGRTRAEWCDDAARIGDEVVDLFAQGGRE